MESTVTVNPAIIPGFLFSIGSEPGGSSQPAEGRDGSSDGPAHEAKAAGQFRQRGFETSHTSSETAC